MSRLPRSPSLRLSLFAAALFAAACTRTDTPVTTTAASHPTTHLQANVKALAHAQLLLHRGQGGCAHIHRHFIKRCRHLVRLIFDDAIAGAGVAGSSNLRPMKWRRVGRA